MKKKLSSREGLTATNYSLEAIYKKNTNPSKSDLLLQSRQSELNAWNTNENEQFS